MKVIKQSWEYEEKPTKVLEKLEKVIRTCYRSEDKIDKGTAEKLVRRCIESKHESVLEFQHIAIRVTTSRAVLAEITRHRIGFSYAVESQRYVDNDNLKVIKPWWVDNVPWKDPRHQHWVHHMMASEKAYQDLRFEGCSKQEARGVLPNDTATQMVICGNLRAWRHFFELRTAKGAYPQIRDLAKSILCSFNSDVPIVFEDLVKE